MDFHQYNCLFLDRDGVINRRIIDGYVRNWTEFEFLPGVLKAMKIFAAHFKYICIVTNQQGVAKGLMHPRDLTNIHRLLQLEVERHGGRIDGIYACTELAAKPNNCRKPAPALALRAQHRFPDIDFSHSIMVGDTRSDIGFGKNLGMRTVAVGPEQELAALANHYFSDLAAFAAQLR